MGRKTKKEKIIDSLYWQERYSDKYVPTMKFGVFLAIISLYGMTGIIWHCVMENANEFTIGAIGWGQYLFGFLWLDIALLVIGVAGFLIAPANKTGRARRAAAKSSKNMKRKYGKGMKNPFSEINILARKEEIFKKYKTIYDLCDRVYYLDNDKCEREAYDAMGQQLGDMYDALSYHDRSLTFSSRQEIEHSILDDALYEVELAKLDNIIKDIDDLTRLWSSPVCLDGVRVLHNRASAKYDAAEHIQAIGDKFGMAARIDAYRNKNIPLKDLLF